ncbi:PP2C family protein-serine/threonine phosphatase [Streptomyces sp. NPDC088354]|uniref:PP2C family protein-serine/threonine phosphatase n=1 Tax=unclassified Streptomyces TaxID=2593676 RepID=UPI0029A59AD6|nr:PP2C family protein-serine/threonine phosphatase [Streptomyces sp. MI02-7b]MDX3071092.1 PP2C family protein-serine/threonine phosphatase [Streptomyces sp. MI02-7b]
MTYMDEFEEERGDKQSGHRLAAAGILGALAVCAVSAVCAILPLHHPSFACGMAPLVTAGAVAIVLARLKNKYRCTATRARAVSDTVRRVLLRPLPSRIGALGIASVYRPCGGRGEVGGDLYAVARTGGATRLIIGDVCGKGLHTFDDVAAVLGAFREWAPRAATLTELSVRLEESFLRHLAEAEDGDRDKDERFVTALLLEVPDGERHVRMVNRGHPPPVRAHRGSVALVSCCSSPPLGLHGLQDLGADEECFELAAGDALLLYTDGLIEARDPSGHCYPLLDRATAWNWIRQDTARHQTLPDALSEILQDLVDHAGALPEDDLAMVALTRLDKTDAAALPRPAGQAGREGEGQLQKD